MTTPPIAIEFAAWLAGLATDAADTSATGIRIGPCNGRSFSIEVRRGDAVKRLQVDVWVEAALSLSDIRRAMDEG